MTTATFTPVTFTKGGVTEIAYSAEDYYQYLWEGWHAGGPAPAVPRSQTAARLSDLDAASAEAQARIAPGVRLYNPKGLQRWSLALSDALRGRAPISVYGDSISKGVGSDGNSADGNLLSYATDGWVGQLRSLFAAQYGDIGEGNVGILEGGGRWTFAGTNAAATASAGPFGNGGRCGNATGSTITVNLSTCSTIEFWCWDGGSGTASLTVDGVATGFSLDGGASGANTFSAGTNTSTALTWTKHTITGLSSATHTLVVTGPTSGLVYLSAVSALKQTTGVPVHRFAVSGRTTAALVGADASLNGNAPGQARMLAATCRVPASSLLIISLGVNDWSLQATTSPTLAQPGTTPATYKANLQTSIDQAVAAGACVLLLGEPRAVPTARTYAEQDYYDQMKALALSNAHVAFVDLADLWGTHSQGDALGLFTTSSVHPTRKGHGSMARLLHRVLTTPFGQNAPAL